MIDIKEALDWGLIYNFELRYLAPEEQDEIIVLRDASIYHSIEGRI